MTAYEALVRCLGIAITISKLSKKTGISRSVLQQIERGRGSYNGHPSTRLRLENFILQNEKAINDEKI